jgi:hypothetical protein
MSLDPSSMLPEEEAQLENRLRVLSPARVRSEFLARVAEAIESEPVVLPVEASQSMALRDWAPLFKLAAVLLMMLGVLSVFTRPGAEPRPAQASTGTPGNEDVQSQRPVVAPAEGVHAVQWSPRFDQLEDDGVIILEGNRPVRRVRMRMHDEFLWGEAQDRGTMRAVIPREESLLLPIVTY